MAAVKGLCVMLVLSSFLLLVSGEAAWRGDGDLLDQEVAQILRATGGDRNAAARQLRKLSAAFESGTAPKEANVDVSTMDMNVEPLDDAEPWANGNLGESERSVMHGHANLRAPEFNQKAAAPFISALGGFTTKSYKALNESSKETTDKDAKILTPLNMKLIQDHVYPSFSGATNYFTGQRENGQADGTPYPGTSTVGSAPGTLGYIANIAPLRIQNAVIWDMLYAADNEGSGIQASGSATNSSAGPAAGKNATVQAAKAQASDERHPVGFGKVRTIDPGSGFISTVSEFDKIDWDTKRQRSIFAVAAHSFIVNQSRVSYVYAAIENNGVFQMDLNSKKMKEVKLPEHAGKDKKHIWEKGYRDVCITAPVSSDSRFGSSMLFLHYKKVVYALDAAKCIETKDCQMRAITTYTHHEGYMKSMACASYSYKTGSDTHTSMYLTQRGGKNAISLDLTDALKVKGATVREELIAKATGKSVDGGDPQFVKFQGIAVYAPKWAKPGEPYILLSGGGELRILDYKKKYVHTLGHTENGAVAALGDDAFSGCHRLYKTELNFHVKCDVLNTQILPQLVKWKIPDSQVFAKEMKLVKLRMGQTDTMWQFKAYKKTAKTLQGVLEKAMVCSRQAKQGTEYFNEHCCMLKFSRAIEGARWSDQTDETELL